MRLLLFLISPLIFFTSALIAQNLEVEGTVKIAVMNQASANAQHVMKEDDGTLTASSMNSSSTFAIGDIAQGGVIFWMNSNNTMGKVVYPFQIYDEAWSNIDFGTIGSKAQNLSNGALNTYAIITQSGHLKSLASLCWNLEYGGFSDWYMPALGEMNQLYNVKDDINQIITGMGGDELFLLNGTDWYFYTSTEESSGYAKFLFSNGENAETLKSNTILPTYAIRTFFIK